MRVLLVSPYHTGSHRQWAEGYREHSAHEVEIVSLPGQFWKWRLSGAAPALADLVRRSAAERGRPDVLLATSMTDLAGLLGLARTALAGVPAALYMHENQVTYPAVGRTRHERRLGLIAWHSLLAADAVAFNSEFHRTAFFEALPGFLGALPDEHGRRAARPDRVGVLPVGVDLEGLEPGGERTDPPLVLWNHRWDPDKAPGEFLAVLGRLAAAGAAFRVGLAGERFVGQGDEYRAAIDALGHRVEVSEHLPREEYRRLLRRSDIVVSTARQEFFGVSVVEAMAAGALPLLPDRLVYRERIPPPHAFRCLYHGEAGLIDRLGAALSDPERCREVGAELAATVRRFDWRRVAARYDAWLDSLA
jgi:glycosyltransferase involved in cell wall biosynthesis